MEIKNRIVVFGAVFAGLFVIALLAWWLGWRKPPFPEGLVQASGRIEGDHFIVASKWPGQVGELLAREGDQVQQDQVLVKLDDAQTLAKVDQARAGVDAAKAQLQAAQTTLAVFRKNVPLRTGTAKAAVAGAEAALASGLAAADQARKDAGRYRELLARQTVEKHRSEQADLAWQKARDDYTQAQATVTQATKSAAEAELGWEQVKAKEGEVAAFAAQLVQAEAALAETRTVQSDLLIHAPAGGMITTRVVDKGEVVAAGSPLFDIVDLDRLYLKVYVPGNQIGKVRLGLPALVYIDAFPDQPYPATVRYIASQAEFTPKEVQTPDERVKLVYAVKLYLDGNPEHSLTPGLPADAVIRWQENAPWMKPRW
jgi:HlyD family secretion protein